MKYTPTNKESWGLLFGSIIQCGFYILLPSLVASWLFSAPVIGAIFGLGMLIITGMSVLSIEIKEAAGEKFDSEKMQ